MSEGDVHGPSVKPQIKQPKFKQKDIIISPTAPSLIIVPSSVSPVKSSSTSEKSSLEVGEQEQNNVALLSNPVSVVINKETIECSAKEEEEDLSYASVDSFEPASSEMSAVSMTKSVDDEMTEPVSHVPEELETTDVESQSEMCQLDIVLSSQALESDVPDDEEEPDQEQDQSRRSSTETVLELEVSVVYLTYLDENLTSFCRKKSFMYKKFKGQLNSNF
jgi:hypothetical protein